jgi:hypothetical protein
MPTTHAPPKPKFCCKPYLTFFICLYSDIPRNCQEISQHCATPDAPTGCPFESKPPDGLTTNYPP